MAKKVLWTEERIRTGVAKFYTEKGHYPSAAEFDAYPDLPRAKTIERRFGGLVTFRKKFIPKADSDLREGTHSSERARTIGTRAHVLEKQVYILLVDRFGKEFVHREYFFHDDKRTRADFYVYDSESGFCVDIFYPSTRHNLIGCLNSKMHKYESQIMREYPVIFLQMNSMIEDEAVREVLQEKKNPLPKGQTLMGLGGFTTFIHGRKPRTR